MEVLSETVRNGLSMLGDEALVETIRFVDKFDKFFDCLNVNSFDAGRHERKTFKQPYRSATDFRLKASEQDNSIKIFVIVT